jgi:hypothetical protein
VVEGLGVLHIACPMELCTVEMSRWRQEYSVSQVPVAHTCNPSYLGGRDQEDCY